MDFSISQEKQNFNEYFFTSTKFYSTLDVNSLPLRDITWPSDKKEAVGFLFYFLLFLDFVFLGHEKRNHVHFFLFIIKILIVTVQLLSHVRLFSTPWTIACQAPLSFTVSWSLLKFMSIESVMLSNHLVLFCPLLLPSLVPSIKK